MYDPKSKLEIVIRANTDMEEKKRLQYAVSETYSEKEDAMVGINVYVGDDGAYVSERFIQQINIIDDEQGVFTACETAINELVNLVKISDSKSQSASL